jgi:hypothetical protein
MTSMAGQLTSAKHAREFTLAGHAMLTLVSVRTGARFTYRVMKGDADNAPHFVSVLIGPRNTRDYQFLGTIFGGTNYRHGHKSRITVDAASAKAFAWVWARLVRDELPTDVEIWHEGRCGKCGRPLTVPESIASGIGPICASG